MGNSLVTINDTLLNIANHLIDYKNIYLISVSIILTAIIWIGWKIKLDKLVEFIFHISIAIILGFLIKILSNGNDTLLSFFSDNKDISLVIYGLFIIVFLKEYFSFSKTKKHVVSNFLKVVYMLSLILLAIFFAIQAYTFLNLYISVTLFSIWSFLNNKKESKNNKSKNNEVSDNPITSYDALFPTRKEECRRIYDYIKNLDTDDPYAIAINAEWGEGKTSLINALKEQMENDQNRKNNIIPEIFIAP